MNGPNAVYTHEEAGLGTDQEHDHDHQPHRAASQPRTQDLEAGQDLGVSPRTQGRPCPGRGPRTSRPIAHPRPAHTPGGKGGAGPVRQNAYTCPDFRPEYVAASARWAEGESAKAWHAPGGTSA